MAVPLSLFKLKLILLIFFKLQLVAYHRLHGRSCSTGQFQHRMRCEANRHSRTLHILSDLEYFTLLVQEQHIDGKLHAEGMNRLAGCDPEAFPRFEPGVLEKSGPSFRAGIGDADAITKDCISG